MMKRLCAGIAATVAVPCSFAVAQEGFEPEVLGVETTIAPGENIFVASPAWGGAGAVSIFSADDLSYKGDYSTGLTAQFVLSADGETGYVASAYPKRIVSGPVEAVLQSFDIATLAMKTEIILPPQFAQTFAQKGGIALSADENFLFAQNATPATSVTIVDLMAGEVTAEAPTPGCWTIIPSLEGAKFTAICGDGTLISVTVDAEGAPAAVYKSAQSFDADTDPLFVHHERFGENLVFISFSGVIYVVSDASDEVELVETFSIVDGVEGGWAPGGYEIMGYNAANGVLFVPMHAESYDGSHKDASEEIWAYDIANKTLLSRSPAEHITHVAVTDAEVPVIFGTNGHDGGLYRFESDPAAGFALTLAGTLEETGDVGLVLTEQ